MRQADLLTDGQVSELVERLSDHFEIVPPGVTFDLPDTWDGNVRVEGRYFVDERRIGFPGLPYRLHDIESVAHEVAHHIDHDRLIAGRGGHDAQHEALTRTCVTLARAFLGNT